MKIIFLDIDGVLNAHEKLASGYCGASRPQVELFNKILRESPDVKIVVSSAWRYMILRGDMTIKGFEFLLCILGVDAHGRVVGHTVADGEVADEPNHFDTELWRSIGLKMRALQIEKYLAENQVDRFVVLDDLPIKVPNLLQTDSGVGITERQVTHALRILNAT